MAKTNPIPPVLSSQDIQRFWSKIDKSPGQGPKGDCWGWTAGCIDGYGQFSVAEGKTRQCCKSTRIAYFLTTGQWPLLHMCHHCDYPPCCRPDHLFDGTQKENMADAAAKGRMASGTRQGVYTHPETIRRGSDCHLAKLNESVVKEIRLLYSSGLRTQRSLAKLNGIHRSTVYQIVSNRIWTHI